jgi:hypothetical protein
MHDSLKVGEWVEVRSKEEILRTLDGQGRLQALPLMPEMLALSGQRFRVHKRAHKTCDPVNGLGARGMDDTVHLEGVRCDGAAHGGCQAGCLMFWKEAWLKRAGDTATVAAAPGSTGCTEAQVVAATVAADSHGAEPVYVCQATRVAEATYPLRWWDPRHYWQDFTSGNVRASQMAATFLFWIAHSLAEAGLGVGAAVRTVYDLVQNVRGGAPYPLRPGAIPKGSKTPGGTLDLQPGELVRVKPYATILETLDEDWRNRGLYFDAEMVPFCGGTFRVVRRVERALNEKTGAMLRFKNDAIILEGVECQARYAKSRKFCPRGYYHFCREIWLERVAAAAEAAAPAPACHEAVGAGR